jgi:anti-sigma factor RsiW
MLKLMAYADGELEGAELAEVEAWIATDPDAARFVNQFASLGELVSVGHAASADASAVAAFDVADAVMAKVVGAAASKPAEVVSLSAARARRQKSFKVGGAVLAALALAASVLVMARDREDVPMARLPNAVTEPAPSATSGSGVDVEVVETPGHSVSVVYLPSENSLTTSVLVWVDETGDKK